jgi:hypothetical protein
MDLLASATKQSTVRRILNKGVLEGILGIGEYSSPEDQLGPNELVQSVIKLLFRDLATALISSCEN